MVAGEPNEIYSQSREEEDGDVFDDVLSHGFCGGGPLQELVVRNDLNMN